MKDYAIAFVKGALVAMLALASGVVLVAAVITVAHTLAF